ncbi:MAG: LapA family protein [Sphingomonadales bacterium]
MTSFRPYKPIKWAILGILGVGIAALAVANRTPVALHFDPLPFRVEAPLYLLILLSLLLGVVMGGATVWMSQRSWRRRARVAERQATKLEREVADIKAGDGPR